MYSRGQDGGGTLACATGPRNPVPMNRHTTCSLCSLPRRQDGSGNNDNRGGAGNILPCCSRRHQFHAYVFAVMAFSATSSVTFQVRALTQRHLSASLFHSLPWMGTALGHSPTENLQCQPCILSSDEIRREECVCVHVCLYVCVSSVGTSLQAWHGTGAGKPQGLPSQRGLKGQQMEVRLLGSSWLSPLSSPTGHLSPPALTHSLSKA